MNENSLDLQGGQRDQDDLSVPRQKERETVLRKDINTAIKEVNYSKDNVPLRESFLKHVLNHILGVLT